MQFSPINFTDELTMEQLMLQVAEESRPTEQLTVIGAAEKYTRINNPGSYVGPFDGGFTPYMVEPTNLMASREFTQMSLVGPVQCGKALDVDTPLRTISGWTTMGKARVGDCVFAPNGQTTKVVAATEYQYGRSCYRVAFSDGSELVADADHLWVVRSIHRTDFETLTTSEILARGVVSRKQSVFTLPPHGPLQTRNSRPLYADPYLLGYWLGDGCRQSGYLTIGRDYVADATRQLTKRGVSLKEIANTGQRAPRFYVQKTRQTKHFLWQLQALGLRENLRRAEKRIPTQYLDADVESRRELLRGLMDSDGTCRGRRAVFSSCEHELSLQVFRLAQSLGYRPSLKTNRASLNGVRKKDRHRVSWTFECSRDVFALDRKISRGQTATTPRISQTQCLRITSIRPVESRPVKCIQVDSPDSMYLAGRGLVPTHNTQMFSSGLTYTVKVEPKDITLYQMTRTAAGDFAISKIDRLHRDSPAVGQMLLPGSASDSQFRKMYRNGVLLRVSWPAPTELAGKSVPFVFLTDYDRMPQDIGGEGPPFDLAAKRTTTYRRNGMAVAESTPSFPVTDPRWQPNADRPHEAPPCQGIIGLYNRGDRRRWLWKCVSCKLPFEPDFSLLKYPASTDFMEAAEAAYMGCPHCGQIYEHGEKNDMNLDYARWIIEGQKWLEDGSVVGKARRSDMASFWIKGPAARFLEWKTLVFEYLTAMDEFTRTGNEKPLQTTVNTQQALPYIPKSLESLRVPEDLKTRATDLGERVVPPTVRFLVATVDIQKHRFVAQVHGLSEGGDITIVDRFDIRYSKRPETEGGKGFSWVKPGAHPEDWNLLIEGVLLKTYPLADNSGRHMQIKMTLCDSGGQTGVTANAYSFYKRLRSPPEANDQIPETLMPDMPPGLHNRFLLVAGRPTESAPRLRITWPDSGRKDRNAGARGEVPLGILNSDRLKDQLDKRLDRTTPRGGRINFPLWLDHNFYAELCVEIRDDKGKWGNPNNYRNESFDLLTYCLAACIHDSIKMERPDFWGDPPSWATEWDANDLVFNPVTDPDRMGGVKKESFDFSKLGEDLA